MSDQIQTVTGPGVANTPINPKGFGALREMASKAWAILKLLAFWKRPAKRTFREPDPEVFVNRYKPIEVFTNAAKSILPDQAFQVLTFHGAGGQGKSHLCRRFRRMLEAEPSEIGPNLRWAIVKLPGRTERSAEYLLLLSAGTAIRSQTVKSARRGLGQFTVHRPGVGPDRAPQARNRARQN